MDFTNMYESARPIVLAFALKAAGAIVLYIIGFISIRRLIDLKV